MRRLSRFVGAACLAWSLGCAEEPAPEPAVNPKQALQSILTGPSEECQRADDCPSGVCKLGFCASVVDAGDPWMEHVIADRLRALLTDHPELFEHVRTSFVDAMERDDAFVQGRAAGVLGALGDPRVLPVLQRWSESPVERVQVRAVLARARLGDATALGPLTELLEHRSVGVTLDAADALAALSTHAPEATAPVLLNLLDSADYRLRLRAIQALGQPALVQQPGVRAALEAVLESESEGFLRYDTRRALGQIQ